MLGNKIQAGHSQPHSSAQLLFRRNWTFPPNGTKIKLKYIFKKKQKTWTEATKNETNETSDPPNIPPLRPADGLKVEPLRPMQSFSRNRLDSPPPSLQRRTISSLLVYIRIVNKSRCCRHEKYYNYVFNVTVVTCFCLLWGEMLNLYLYVWKK